MSDANNPNLTQPGPDEERPRRRRKRKRRFSLIRFLFQTVGTLLLIALVTVALLASFAAVYIQTVIIPMTPLDLTQFQVGLNSTLYYMDEDGNPQELRTLHGDESRVWVQYEDLPQDLINATVAIEDQRFWTHPGVDWKRTAAAILYMFTGKDIQGGSTITQQLLKNITGYDDTNVKRKIVEIFRALEFNKNYSKETTLEWYLSYIYLGRGCYGVYTASYMYFGKPLEELTVAECASLISITNNPSLYDPYTNPENNLKRKDLVLWCMWDQGYLNDEEYETAKAQELVFQQKKVELDLDEETERSGNSGVYSWYEEQVITDVTKDLAAELGITEKFAYDMVLSGGLSIYTCVNPEIQSIVEEIYENPENFPWPSDSGQQLQSAITVIDNATGDVVAIAGQVGEKTGNRWRNNATAASRQPGSSFKPLSVYAPALDMGLVTPITVLDDYPYELSGGNPYPVNAGNAKYRGLTTVSTALINSTNTVAYRMLTDLVTPSASFQFVEQKFKIDLIDGHVDSNGNFSSDMDRAPLSMGGLTEGVNTRDMAEAFAVFPNEGIYKTSRTYTKVLNSDKKVLLENNTYSEVVIKDTTAYYMNSMLQSVVTSGTGTEAKLTNMHAAGKTGSSTSDKDRWFAGYTPYYTAVVWTGYSQPERVRSSGKNPAAITWKSVMSQIHEGLEDKDFFTINNLVTVEYCKDSGLLPTDACRNDIRGNRVGTATLHWDDAPTQYCNVHSEAATVTICVDSPIEGASMMYHLAGPYCLEWSLRTYYLLDYDREQIDSAVANDEKYTLSFIQSHGLCPVHAEPPEPEIVDPEWPDWGLDPDDPNSGLIDSDDPDWPGNTTDPDESEPEVDFIFPPDEEPYVPARN